MSMKKIIDDIWILLDSGIVLYSRCDETKVDAQLFGGLMSAINMFAEDLVKGGITNFELSKKKYTISKMKDLLFVASSDKKLKQKTINSKIKEVEERFCDCFERELKLFDGDVACFQDFELEQREVPIKQFQQAFW